MRIDLALSITPKYKLAEIFTHLSARLGNTFIDGGCVPCGTHNLELFNRNSSQSEYKKVELETWQVYANRIEYGLFKFNVKVRKSVTSCYLIQKKHLAYLIEFSFQ